jgi:GTPase SAR1 family protein
VVYSIVDRDSFAAVEDWIAEIRKYTLEDIKVLLLGNKADLDNDRAVSTVEGAVRPDFTARNSPKS